MASTSRQSRETRVICRILARRITWTPFTLDGSPARQQLAVYLDRPLEHLHGWSTGRVGHDCEGADLQEIDG